MRCYECGGTLVKHKGSVTFHDKVVGDFTVHNISYRKCDSCGEYAFPAGVSTIIEEAKKERLEYLIGKLPLDDFITASEVANILGISRQALNKHRRIRRGFIHSKRHGDRLLYNKKSVEQYKETGDGRFPLLLEEPQAVVFQANTVIQYVPIFIVSNNSNSLEERSGEHPTAAGFVGFDWSSSYEISERKKYVN